MSTNKKKRIVVIGSVAAGNSAASKAKIIDSSADVKIIAAVSIKVVELTNLSVVISQLQICYYYCSCLGHPR
jgi:hypothetical protein